MLPTPLSAPLSPGFGHALYLPWTYLTSGRACGLAAAVEGAPESHPTIACRQPCRHHVLLAKHADVPRRVVQRGAAAFMDCSGDVERFHRSAARGFSTLVFEPSVPF